MFAWGVDTFATIQHPLKGGVKNWELECVFWRATMQYIKSATLCEFHPRFTVRNLLLFHIFSVICSRGPSGSVRLKMIQNGLTRSQV